MKHRSFFPALLVMLAFSSCGVVDRVMGRGPEAAAPMDTVPEGQPPSTEPLGGAQSAEALDQTTDAEKAVATAAPAQGGARDLGTVVVALGSPAEQGFWLRSALVTAPSTGRIVTAAGQSVTVDLQPGGGAALLSLAAYRALGLGLTDLPEVQVFAN